MCCSSSVAHWVWVAETCSDALQHPTIVSAAHHWYFPHIHPHDSYWLALPLPVLKLVIVLTALPPSVLKLQVVLAVLIVLDKYRL